MSAVASFFVVMALSLLIARIATVALAETGISREIAKFQSRSALTGTGFTTEEAEKIVNHPVRRRIIMTLMIVRNAGLITAISSFILSFADAQSTLEAVKRAGIIGSGIGFLWLFSQSHVVERWMSRLIRKALRRWTNLDARDYARLLDIGGDYGVKEMSVSEGDWICGKDLRETELQSEGILVLGIQRNTGDYLGAPTPDTEFEDGDVVVLYGPSNAIQGLDERLKGSKGDQEHREAVSEQKERERKEQKEDRSRGNADSGEEER